MYVIIGASGRTGSAVAGQLLDRKAPVRVVLRDPAKASAWKARGAEIAMADLRDTRALETALRGASAAYFMIPPPSFDASGILAVHREMIDSLAEAALSAGLPRAVVLSSMGADRSQGTGTIRSLHHAEQRLGGILPATTFLRAAYFLENWLDSLDAVLKGGVLPTFLSPDRKIPMIATLDIGVLAATELVGPSVARGVVDLAGPDEYSPSDVARAFGKALGRPVQLLPQPAGSMTAALTGFGVSAELAELFTEMTEWVNTTDLRADNDHTVRGTIGLDEFVASVLSAQR